MERINDSITCDVCCCKHNQKGCNCMLENIRVTTGNHNLKNHFCGSYECKEEYEDNNYLDTANKDLFSQDFN